MTPPHFYKTKSFQNKLLETFSTFTEHSGVKTFLLSPGKTDMLSELFRTIHSSFLPFFKTKEENKTYIFLNCTFFCNFIKTIINRRNCTQQNCYLKLIRLRQSSQKKKVLSKITLRNPTLKRNFL
jgi:hypothetical protein